MAERGSTLLEVLVALAVLGIGIAGSARLLLLGLAAESRAALREAATLRLADAMELSRAWSGATPPARAADWRAAAKELRPDAPQSVTATLELLPASAGQPQPLRATLAWGDAAADTASLRSAVYATAAAP
jgi:prepilin-type N-terminal cleavage/methylation domain-containing protein